MSKSPECSESKLVGSLNILGVLENGSIFCLSFSNIKEVFTEVMFQGHALSYRNYTTRDLQSPLMSSLKALFSFSFFFFTTWM